MVQPTRDELGVVGVFNPAAIRHGDDTILLLRVAEGVREVAEDMVAAPVYDAAVGAMVIRRWHRGEHRVDTTDPRMTVIDGKTWLTSISHLRVARSSDGIHFIVEPVPALLPTTVYESFGVEDARITRIDATYWINYSAVSSYGIATGLASTRDFRVFARHGIIFPPNNRDVTILPGRIGGRYHALHRPMPAGLGEVAIWSASSHDMLAWGDHRLVAMPRAGRWDDEKIGGGAVPFRVRAHGVDGWLAVYHGVTKASGTYSLGALLLAPDDPSRVVARSIDPIMAPEAPYEREGFYGGVVFTCGLVDEGDRVRVYYGAADGVTAVADLSLARIIAGLGAP
ncbi:MAG: glycoside hydrolase family 130 protein [Gemmatimonadetes bacterium]|nr:glycoside hydrolase family 130 protein [Gemmatimonadota bacterium]